MREQKAEFWKFVKFLSKNISNKKALMRGASSKWVMSIFSLRRIWSRSFSKDMRIIKINHLNKNDLRG